MGQWAKYQYLKMNAHVISNKWIICNELIETKYLTYYLRAKRKDIFDTAKYTTLPILNQEESKKSPIILCSIEEQQNIIAFIETKTHSVDKAIERIKKK